MKPILFNTEMVRAILDGRKTATRRVVKPQHLKVLDSPFHKEHPEISDKQLIEKLCEPPFQPGDILYVRETWGDYRECSQDSDGFFYLYRADYPDGAKTVPFPEKEKTDYADAWDLPKWHPSIHMPKEAARIFLRVTDVRVERLQEIDGAGIKAEGTTGRFGATRGAFINLWNSTVKPTELDKYGWAANPWVWVIEFERCEKPTEGET